MNDITLESLAKRVDALERSATPKKDWRRVVGLFDDSEFMKRVVEECRTLREAEREAARAEPSA